MAEKKTPEESRNHFAELYAVNVNDRTEQKNGLTYLSWAWAYAEFLKVYPDAVYEIVKFDGIPYAYDPRTGYMVYTRITAGGITREMWLPVMDGANKAMKAEPYEYTVKNPNHKYATKQPDGTWLGRLPDQPISSLAQHTGNTERTRAIHTRKWFLTRIGLAAMIVLVMGGMAFGAVRIYDQVVNTTEAPYCLDETEGDAIRLINRAGLKYDISRTSDAVKPAGSVIMQSPEFGTSMRKNETVFLTVSTGPEEQEIPGILGMSVESARNELERLGFTLLALPERSLSSSAWDTVLSQNPVEGEMMPSGSVVQVVLSGGSVTLPNFVGMTRDEAMYQIQQLRLNIQEIRDIPVDDASQFERVAAQSFSDDRGNVYKEGDQVMQQTQVILAVYVSSQPEASQSPVSAEESSAMAEEAAQ